MSDGPARIEGPEVIQEFRRRFLEFADVCRNALASLDSDVRSTATWLKTDRVTYWKMQHRKREEAYNLALNEYNRARDSTSAMGKASTIDEKKAMERAKRAKEEAEERLQAVGHWTRLLEHQVEKLSGPCASLSILLSSLTPRAVARLDQMLDALDEYFRPAPGGSE